MSAKIFQISLHLREFGSFRQAKFLQFYCLSNSSYARSVILIGNVIAFFSAWFSVFSIMSELFFRFVHVKITYIYNNCENKWNKKFMSTVYHTQNIYFHFISNLMEHDRGDFRVSFDLKTVRKSVNTILFNSILREMETIFECRIKLRANQPTVLDTHR